MDKGIKCHKCGETRIIQRDSSDLGYDFVVFGCYSQYHVFPEKVILVHQGNWCKDKEILIMKELLIKVSKISDDIEFLNVYPIFKEVKNHIKYHK